MSLPLRYYIVISLVILSYSYLARIVDDMIYFWIFRNSVNSCHYFIRINCNHIMSSFIGKYDQINDLWIKRGYPMGSK